MHAISVATILCIAASHWGCGAARAPACPPTLERAAPSKNIRAADVCDAAARPALPAEPPAEPALVLTPVTFADLPGWQDDAVGEALPALARSCKVVAGWAPERPVGPDGLAGTAADWRPACTALGRVDGGDANAARGFFETFFAPFAASNRDDPVGRFTGYYEASIQAARKRGGRYQTPIYARPPELVMVHMSDFHESPRPRRLAGRVVGGRLRPYVTRAEIAAGALAKRGLELFWASDPIDVFFAEIQGSGRVVLPDGKVVRIGYAGQNGHVYTAIGRELLAAGEIAREEMSMQAIRRWLEAHPAEAQEMMNRNASFVFFAESGKDGALGSQSVVLTPERSMAVDPYFIPLFTPIFVDTEVPVPGQPGQTEPWRRLVIAQDTGGAIRGPVRGDIFFGAGERATDVAGRLRGTGRYFLLLPRAARP